MGLYTERSLKWFKETTPQNAVKASAILTISGVVVEGETVSIGDETYEFETGGSITAGNIDVDLSASATASQGTLTIDTQITNTNTMTIGTTVYTFVTDGTEASAGEVSIGTDLATCQANLVAAVNGTDALNSPHPLVTIGNFVADDAIITAISGGVAGDLIATTETFTAGTNVFDGLTLGTTTAGVDAIASTAVTALALAITNNSALVTGVDGAGDTVDVASLLVGTEGNLITTTEAMVNGAFDTATLEDGVYATQSASPCFIIIAGKWYSCSAPVSKWDETGWKVATPATI